MKCPQGIPIRANRNPARKATSANHSGETRGPLMFTLGRTLFHLQSEPNLFDSHRAVPYGEGKSPSASPDSAVP